MFVKIKFIDGSVLKDFFAPECIVFSTFGLRLTNQEVCMNYSWSIIKRLCVKTRR